MAHKLFIDIGNSNIKWRFNKKSYLSNISKFTLNKLPKATDTWISCVANYNLVNKLKANVVKPKTYKDLIFNYNLSQLGVDRYLTIIAAYEMYPHTAKLIIDVGSAITTDLVVANNYHGGNIAPGLSALKNSLIKFATDEYSLNKDKLYANNSKENWLIGTKKMLEYYIIQSAINFKKQYNNGQVLITGGGAKYIKIKDVEYIDNLVLDGLHYISLV